MSGPTDPGQSHGVGARARADQAALDSRNLFSLDTTVLDLRRLGPADLEHRYGSSPAELSMYERVTRLVSGLEQSYAVEHGAAAPNPMECTPDEAALLRGWYAGKSEYLEALELLGIPAGVVGGQLRRPWWNRVTCAERGYAAGEEGALLELVPRHSYEIDSGRYVTPSAQNVSVAALITTVPERDAPDGYLVLGLRGGHNFRNTFMLSAGSLRPTPELVGEGGSLWEFLLEVEVAREMGITSAQVDLQRSAWLARVLDLAQFSESWPHYVAEISTTLSKRRLEIVWERNTHPDRHEHRRLEFVPNNQAAVSDFIGQYYRGACRNDPTRTEGEVRLLGVAAVALALKSGVDLQQLNLLNQIGKNAE